MPTPPTPPTPAPAPAPAPPPTPVRPPVEVGPSVTFLTQKMDSIIVLVTTYRQKLLAAGVDAASAETLCEEFHRQYWASLLSLLGPSRLAR